MIGYAVPSIFIEKDRDSDFGETSYSAWFVNEMNVKHGHYVYFVDEQYSGHYKVGQKGDTYWCYEEREGVGTLGTAIIIENDRRNSGVPLLDMKNIKARIEPGAIIREKVEIGEGAVIMMGAVINIGAIVGKGTMIDMGAVLGGRATVGANCHIGAGAVLAGVVEPASATPVIVEDGVLVGANAVVIEGVHVGKNAVVAAGAVVVEDVPENAVVAGCPAKIIKYKDEKTAGKTALVDALRKL